MQQVLSLVRRIGFFSVWTQVLSMLDEWPNNDVITYWNSNSLYWHPSGWNGSRNVWNYYFEPTSNNEVESIMQGTYYNHKLNYWNKFNDRWEYRNVGQPYDTAIPELENMNDNVFKHFVDNNKVYVISWHPNDRTGWGGSGWLESNRTRLKDVIDRRIKVKANILAIADNYAFKHMAGKNVVGIHYRGTDKHHELQHCPGYDGRGPVPFEHYLKLLDKVDNRSLVYLATDSQAAFDMAQQHLGSRLLIQNGWFRSSGEPLHMSGVDANNKASHGEQVVVDWLLLSRCDYFIHGISNLSAAALFMNPNLQHLDVYQNRVC